MQISKNMLTWKSNLFRKACDSAWRKIYILNIKWQLISFLIKLSSWILVFWIFQTITINWKFLVNKLNIEWHWTYKIKRTWFGKVITMTNTYKVPCNPKRESPLIFCYIIYIRFKIQTQHHLPGKCAISLRIYM